MHLATKTLAFCSFALLLLTPGCADDAVTPLGYTKVTPTSIPGTTSLNLNLEPICLGNIY